LAVPPRFTNSVDPVPALPVPAVPTFHRIEELAPLKTSLNTPNDP